MLLTVSISSLIVVITFFASLVLGFIILVLLIKILCIVIQSTSRLDLRLSKAVPVIQTAILSLISFNTRYLNPVPFKFFIKHVHEVFDHAVF